MIYRAAALVLGLVIAAYWGRVVRMAYKARKKTGRAGNFLPAEQLGLALRIIWVPVVIVWVVNPFVVAFAQRTPLALHPLWQNAWAAWAGAVIAAACFLATRLCWKTMGQSWRMGI